MTVGLDPVAAGVALARPADGLARRDHRIFLDTETASRVAFIARELADEIGGKPSSGLAVRYLLAEAGWLTMDQDHRWRRCEVCDVLLDVDGEDSQIHRDSGGWVHFPECPGRSGG